MFILWNSISAIFYEDRECCLHILPKQHTFFINGLIFGIMNIQNNQSLEFEWKPMLTPLKCVNDWRFSWIRNDFLKAFQDWLNSVQQRQGNFAKDVGQKIFISWQTYVGLKINVNSIIEATQFLNVCTKFMYWINTFANILSKIGLVVKDLYDWGKIIQLWLTFDITIMLLETLFQTNH